MYSKRWTVDQNFCTIWDSHQQYMRGPANPCCQHLYHILNFGYLNGCLCVCSVLSDSKPHGLCRPPGFSVHEFPRQEYWSRMPFCPIGDLPHLGIKLPNPALAGGYHWATWDYLLMTFSGKVFCFLPVLVTNVTPI